MLYRQLIYNYPEQLFADAGVMAIEHADFDGIERLALVLGKLYTQCSYVHSLREIKVLSLGFICLWCDRWRNSINIW